MALATGPADILPLSVLRFELRQPANVPDELIYRQARRAVGFLRDHLQLPFFAIQEQYILSRSEPFGLSRPYSGRQQDGSLLFGIPDVSDVISLSWIDGSDVFTQTQPADFRVQITDQNQIRLIPSNTAFSRGNLYTLTVRRGIPLDDERIESAQTAAVLVARYMWDGRGWQDQINANSAFNLFTSRMRDMRVPFVGVDRLEGGRLMPNVVVDGGAAQASAQLPEEFQTYDWIYAEIVTDFDNFYQIHAPVSRLSIIQNFALQHAINFVWDEATRTLTGEDGAKILYLRLY